MRLVFALPLVAAIALAACNKGSVTAENESAESVANKVQAANIKPKPGRWESTVKIEKFDMKGVPEQAKAAMQQQMSAEQKFASCLTPEEVNRPNGGFFGGGNDGCTYKNFTMAGGKIDAEMICGKDAFKQDMTMTGTYGASDYAIKIDAKSEVQPGMPMAITMGIASKRVGDCTGKEES